jgi:hypothetical protein
MDRVVALAVEAGTEASRHSLVVVPCFVPPGSSLAPGAAAPRALGAEPCALAAVALAARVGQQIVAREPVTVPAEYEASIAKLAENLKASKAVTEGDEEGERMLLDYATRIYQREHPNTSYYDALWAVRGRSALRAGPAIGDGVDPERAQLDHRVRAYQLAHGVDYMAALRAVQEGV